MHTSDTTVLYDDPATWDGPAADDSLQLVFTILAAGGDSNSCLRTWNWTWNNQWQVHKQQQTQYTVIWL